LQLPAQLAAAIESLVAEHDFKQVRAAAERISETYRAGATGSPLTSDTERAAYLAVRFPATYTAISAVLEELKARAPQFAPLTLLDLGAGPGTATYAADQVFPSLQDVMLVEQDKALVEIGRELAMMTAHRDWYPGDMRSAPLPERDLAIAAYSLGELSAADAAKVVERAWKAAKVLCVIEPGTPRGYATIMRVRDQLLGQGLKPLEEKRPDGAAEAAPLRNQVHLVAPCPHERECPMATQGVPSAKADSSSPESANAARFAPPTESRGSTEGRSSTGDWCHFAARVERSSLHRRMKSGELGWEDEKLSYVIFSKDPQIARAKARIVRHPQIGKRHIKLELCAQAGLELVTISKRQGEVYRQARRARWGDSWDI
jgi:ribosomal protein RSM22 (predicted rRNA methylase)